ncbi:MAG: LysM peptidoglycan-binding domain-containing protein [Burkholderiaceae bacterium]|nr:LysM peptidoglycan-binding domain-containing protein [Burkholderiaceae bacterium]
MKFRSALLAILSCGVIQHAAATEFVDLLGEIAIEDEVAQAVEARLAQEAVIAPEDTVWETIRQGFGLADLPEAVVNRELKRYTKHLQYTQRMAFRSRMYLYYIVSETQRRGMPTEIALLPFVESAFQPEALSKSKAAGLWQFIPSTGDIFDLRQSSWRDDRLDVLESTRAALDYLQNLYQQFGDWHLALAAYNWGEGSIRRVISINERRGRPTDFMSLQLPAETKRYVPKLLAIKALIKDPQKFNLKLPEIANEPYFVRITKSRDLDLETAAQLAETDLEEFKLLNPSFNRPVIVAAHQRPILIPAEKADVFVSNLLNWQATGKPLSNWSTYTLKPGDTLLKVANRFGMTVPDLRAANKIPAGRNVKIGSTLLVKQDGSEDISHSDAKSKMELVPLPSKRQIIYHVRKGDTISTVAKHFGVKIADIRRINRLKGNAIRVGQRLKLEVRDVQRRKISARNYTVRAGDTLYSIAKKFNLSVSHLRDTNDLDDLQLKPGQRLRIVP